MSLSYSCQSTSQQRTASIAPKLSPFLRRCIKCFVSKSHCFTSPLFNVASRSIISGKVLSMQYFLNTSFEYFMILSSSCFLELSDSKIYFLVLLFNRRVNFFDVNFIIILYLSRFLKILDK